MEKDKDGCPNCGSLKYNKMVKSGKYECYMCGYKEKKKSTKGL